MPPIVVEGGLAMEHKDLEKQFHCGPIKAAYENSKWFSGFMRVLFLLVAIYFFWLMMGEAHLVEHLDNWAVLAFLSVAHAPAK